jgi:hypothetical protein
MDYLNTQNYLCFLCNVHTPHPNLTTTNTKITSILSTKTTTTSTTTAASSTMMSHQSQAERSDPVRYHQAGSQVLQCTYQHLCCSTTMYQPKSLYRTWAASPMHVVLDIQTMGAPVFRSSAPPCGLTHPHPRLSWQPGLILGWIPSCAMFCFVGFAHKRSHLEMQRICAVGVLVVLEVHHCRSRDFAEHMRAHALLSIRDNETVRESVETYSSRIYLTAS